MFYGNPLSKTATHILHLKVAQNGYWGHPKELLLSHRLHSSYYQQREISYLCGQFPLSACSVMWLRWMADLCHTMIHHQALHYHGTLMQKEPTAFLLKLQHDSKTLQMAFPVPTCRIHSSLFILRTQILCVSYHLSKNVASIPFILDFIMRNSLGLSDDSVLQSMLWHFVSRSHSKPPIQRVLGVFPSGKADGMWT
jgi:hypothetical protein